MCTNDSKINDEGLLSSGLINFSAARSGCGIIPTTLPSSLHMPAICSTEPLTWSSYAKTIWLCMYSIEPTSTPRVGWDAIRRLIYQREMFIWHIFAGKYLDCGTMKGYINSTIEISKL